jgi:hypothetical protein
VTIKGAAKSVIAFLIAPAIGTAIIPTWWAVNIWAGYGPALAIKAFVGDFVWAIMWGYSATIVIGLPLYAMLRMERWCGLIPFLFASYLVGIAWPVMAFIAAFIKTGPATPHANLIYHLIWWGGSGVVGGLILWLIDRPDLRVSRVSNSGQ